MGTIINYSNIKMPKTAVVLGNFDGLHNGHMTLINKSLQLSKEQRISSSIFTFEPHPSFILSSKPNVKLIFTREEKEAIIKELGIDYYIQYPFIPAVANYEPEQFVNDIILDKLNPHTVIIGEDYRFGKMRKGDAKMMKELAKKCNFDVVILEKLKYDDREVSSTWVREEIQEGNIEVANKLLGREFFFIGTVCEGAKLGRTIGFPTANLAHPTEKLLPPNGVYSSIIELGDRELVGITNIGNKPTVYSDEKTIETHILDFDEDIYGEEIKVRLNKFIRKERRFDSLEYLKKQIEIDLKEVVKK